MLKHVSRFLILLLLIGFSQPVLAEKTDIVYLKNGDRVTGEVKSLFQSKLEFSTDHMGTIFIEWDDIREIVSSTNQSVELTNGQRFLGPLSKADNGEMITVKTEQGAVGVSTTDVVSMYPVEAGFWDRLDLSFSLGFSWDKGSNVGKYNLGLESEYRTPRFISQASLSTEVTTQSGKDDTSRSSFELSHLVHHKNKRFHQIFGSLEANDELGIDLRTLIGAGYGMAPIRSQRNWFSLTAGLAVNHEVPTEGEDETNLEAVGRVSYDYYKYNTPERRFKVAFTVFPSITDLGRWRANFDTNFTFEFVPDFFWRLDFYASYDNQPISDDVDTSSSDYGIVSSLAYKF